MGHPAIAIACKVQDDCLYRITQCNLLGSLGWLNQDVLLGIIPGTIDEAPARRDDAWKWAASPDMLARLPHVAVEGELAQRFF
jgi:hypothetical protein